MSAADVIDDDEEIEIDLDEIPDEIDVAPEPPKRGRGRPRKNQDTPPNAASSPKKSGRPRKSLKAELEAPLMMAAAMWHIGDPYCGEVAMKQVPQIAAALDNWARSSTRVYEILSMGATGGGPVGVLLATTPLLLAVVQHHNPQSVAMRRAYAEQQAAEAESAEWQARAEEAAEDPLASPFDGFQPTNPGY